jgi:hypothetical protein
MKRIGVGSRAAERLVAVDPHPCPLPARGRETLTLISS